MPQIRYSSHILKQNETHLLSYYMCCRPCRLLVFTNTDIANYCLSQTIKVNNFYLLYILFLQPILSIVYSGVDPRLFPRGFDFIKFSYFRKDRPE